MGTNDIYADNVEPLDINPDILADEWRKIPAIQRHDRDIETPLGYPYDYSPGVPYNFPEPPISRTLRPLTVIWGFVIVAIALLTLISNVAGIQIDFNIVSIVMLAAAGLALIASAVSSSIRKSLGRR